MSGSFGILSRLVRATLVVVALAFVSTAVAAEGVPQPHPAKGKGEACVAETDFMRRNHPDLLKHQRDDTLRLGIRGDKFSLKECVACHAVPGADSQPVTVQDPKHFCRECHDYTAVRIDCFECHNSVPDDKRSASIDFTMPGTGSSRRTVLSLDQCSVGGAG
jgi:predicted CXXCH cytochrome family protein